MDIGVTIPGVTIPGLIFSVILDESTCFGCGCIDLLSHYDYILTWTEIR